MNQLTYTICIILLLSVIYDACLSSVHPYSTNKYMRASHSGFIRGALIGCVLGDHGLYSAVNQGAVFGIINPIVLYMGY